MTRRPGAPFFLGMILVDLAWIRLTIGDRFLYDKQGQAVTVGHLLRRHGFFAAHGPAVKDLGTNARALDK